MVGKNKKRLEISLSLEDAELLNSLSLRFNITKSDVIRQSLKVFAAKRKHLYQVRISEAKKYIEPKSNEIDNSIDWDFLQD